MKDALFSVMHCWQCTLGMIISLQVHLSQRSIGVSYDTSSDQLERIPDLIRDLVEIDPLLKLKSCRLMTIAAFSYEFNFRFHAHHGSLSAIKDSIDPLNHFLGIALIKRSFHYNSRH